MKKKFMAAVLSTVLLIGSMAGCGKADLNDSASGHCRGNLRGGKDAGADPGDCIRHVPPRAEHSPDYPHEQPGGRTCRERASASIGLERWRL